MESVDKELSKSIQRHLDSSKLNTKVAVFRCKRTSHFFQGQRTVTDFLMMLNSNFMLLQLQRMMDQICGEITI